MDIRLASCTLLLHLLILLGDFGSTGRELSSNIPKETSLLRLHSMDIQEKNDHSSSLMNHRHHHMDPSVIVFFFLDDLKQGNKMPVYFRKISASHFLPKEEADRIPFSLASLQDLLQRFSFSQGSPQAIAMEDTLRQCETKPIKGEIKSCPTSLESMLEFVEKIFGAETQIKALSTSHLTKSEQSLQLYTILKPPEEILAPKMVACHTIPYPYAVFYCHYQESMSKIFKVPLRGENGDRVEAVAVCHMDTSQWSPNHVSFSVLGIEPGSSPVCHFFPADNLLWIPTNSPV